MVMWARLQMEIFSRLAQHQEIGPRGYPPRPNWTTLHPENTSGSKIFFSRLTTQCHLCKKKGSSWPSNLSLLQGLNGFTYPTSVIPSPRGEEGIGKAAWPLSELFAIMCLREFLYPHPLFSPPGPQLRGLRWDGRRRGGERCKQRLVKVSDSNVTAVGFLLPSGGSRGLGTTFPTIISTHISSFLGEQPEVQKGEMTCPRSHNEEEGPNSEWA